MSTDPPDSTRAQRPCPRCGKPAVARYRPFCSSRCADIDLGRWLNGDYRVPVDERDEDATNGVEPD